jgi:hypothetical protein
LTSGILDDRDEDRPYGTTLEKEVCRRNTAINAVAARYRFQAGGVARGQPPIGVVSPILVTDVSPQLAAEDRALSAAMLTVFKEKRPTICVQCQGDKSLPLDGAKTLFATPGDLTKQFKRKCLANNREGNWIECKVCQMPLQNKMHLQNHVEKVHGTVS